DDEDLDIQSLLDVIDEDTEAFEALQQYVSTGKLDTVKYTSVNALVNKINEHYYELDRYNAFLEEYPDRDVAEKASAVITELEALTAQINTDTPVYNDEKSGEEPYSLNTNKVTILKNVLVTQLENKGLVTTVQTTTTTRAATKATTTTTKKKTTKKTTKETTTTTTTTTPMQQTAPPETTTTTAAPVITTTPAPVVTAATTPKPSYTITECNKTIYALQDSVFYDQPDTSSDVRGSCTKYYNANCTGETDNGFYRVVVDGFTLYAVKAAFSDDPQSTVVTTKPVKLDNGSVNKYTKEMLKYINALRKEVGVDPLEGYETLDEAADQRAKELKTLFDHTRPNNKSFTTVYGEFGLKYGSVGENITYGMNKTYEVADAFENWKNSPTHYANMTNPDFRYMAIGYYTFTDKDGNDYNYWEQLFYTP
ncbi:MAG: CAP domain-containing protein, partial [Ruminococcus sp.]|nr:CAP domain-containing protein [Ruminococcus sp.]